MHTVRKDNIIYLILNHFRHFPSFIQFIQCSTYCTAQYRVKWHTVNRYKYTCRMYVYLYGWIDILCNTYRKSFGHRQRQPHLPAGWMMQTKFKRNFSIQYVPCAPMLFTEFDIPTPSFFNIDMMKNKYILINILGRHWFTIHTVYTLLYVNNWSYIYMQ